MASEKEIEAATAEIDKYIGNGPLAETLAKAALEAAEAVRWQPIESAPKDEPVLLGWPGMRKFAVVAQWIRCAWRLDDTDEYCIAGRPKPVYFQPLPSPPESKSK